MKSHPVSLCGLECSRKPSALIEAHRFLLSLSTALELTNWLSPNTERVLDGENNHTYSSRVRSEGNVEQNRLKARFIPGRSHHQYDAPGGNSHLDCKFLPRTRLSAVDTLLTQSLDAIDNQVQFRSERYFAANDLRLF